jgi:hypothetical protein
MINVYLPIHSTAILEENKSLFLAGTIEMGNSRDWQAEVIDFIKRSNIESLNIFNPRRVVFDQNDKEEIYNQITWELDNIAQSDFIFMNLCKDTVSPISLLEIGLILSLLKTSDLTFIIHVEHGYLRDQNVAVTLNHWAFHNPKVKVFFSTENKSTYAESLFFLIDSMLK